MSPRIPFSSAQRRTAVLHGEDLTAQLEQWGAGVALLPELSEGERTAAIAGRLGQQRPRLGGPAVPAS